MLSGDTVYKLLEFDVKKKKDMKIKHLQTICHLGMGIFNILLSEVINTNLKAPEKVLEES